LTIPTVEERRTHSGAILQIKGVLKTLPTSLTVTLREIFFMELNDFFEQLKLKMEAETDAISTDQSDPLKWTSLLIDCVGRYVREFKRYVVK